MAHMRVIAVLLLALSAELALGREQRKTQPEAGHVSSRQLEQGKRPQQMRTGFGDLDSLLKAFQGGKLDIKDLDRSKIGSNVPDSSKQPHSEAPAGDVKQPVPQQPPQVPVVTAPAPAPAAPQPAPIVNQPRGSLTCSHQYQYGEQQPSHVLPTCGASS